MSAGDTLILNSDGHPLSIIPLSVISWQESIKLLYQDKVVSLENYNDWTVHSARLAMQVPAVVMTKRFHEQTTRVRFTKNNLYFRDQAKCQYCGETFSSKELTLDHVVPRSHGGRKIWTNIVLSCPNCNFSRGNDTRIQPIKKPLKPSYYELVNYRKKFPITVSHESWKQFLNWPEELIIIGNNNKEEKFSLDQIKDFRKL
jgi:5-methylcytosine-specific restriction endonuclease McrA